MLLLPIGAPALQAQNAIEHRRTEAPQDSLLIVILGSSTAKGAGVSHPDSSWVRRFARALKTYHPEAKVVNAAQWAYTSYHFLPTGDTLQPDRPAPDTSRSITALMLLKPSAVIINLPSNDAAAGYDSAEQAGNLERIIETADSVPVWICTPQPRRFSDSAHALQRSVLTWMRQRFATRLIDFYTGLAADDGSPLPQYDSGDGVHLNDAAHGILAERALAADIPASLRKRNEASHRALPPPGGISP